MEKYHQNSCAMSEQEFLRNQREQFYDRKFTAALEAAVAAEEGMDTGLGGGEMGELGGDLDLGGEDALDLGDEEGSPPGGEEPGGEEPGGEEDILLAEPPGNRRDELGMGIVKTGRSARDTKPHVTKGSNGKVYRPMFNV